MAAIHTITHDDSSGTANKTSDKITGKTGNETRQARTHTWAPPKLKSLQHLNIMVKPEVTEEVMHHAGLRVDGSLHLHLHMCKVIYPSLESSDPLHRVLSLVNPITKVPLQGTIPISVPGRGGGFGSKARLGVTMRGIVTTTLMVTRVANPIPCVPLGLLRVSLRCSRGLLCCLHTSSPTNARWSYEAVACLSHPIKLQCKTFTASPQKASVGECLSTDCVVEDTAAWSVLSYPTISVWKQSTFPLTDDPHHQWTDYSLSQLKSPSLPMGKLLD
jgi:hypothetical protein